MDEKKYFTCVFDRAEDFLKIIKSFEILVNNFYIDFKKECWIIKSKDIAGIVDIKGYVDKEDLMHYEHIHDCQMSLKMYNIEKMIKLLETIKHQQIIIDCNTTANLELYMKPNIKITVNSFDFGETKNVFSKRITTEAKTEIRIKSNVLYELFTKLKEIGNEIILFIDLNQIKNNTISLSAQGDDIDVTFIEKVNEINSKNEIIKLKFESKYAYMISKAYILSDITKIVICENGSLLFIYNFGKDSYIQFKLPIL